MYFLVEKDLVIVLINYLSTKPYNEVSKLIEALRQSKLVETKEDKKESEGEL